MTKKNGSWRDTTTLAPDSAALLTKRPHSGIMRNKGIENYA